MAQPVGGHPKKPGLPKKLPKGKRHKEQPRHEASETQSLVPTPESLLDSAFRRGGKAEVRRRSGKTKGQLLAAEKVDLVSGYLSSRLQAIAAKGDLSAVSKFHRELVAIAVDLGFLERAVRRIGGAVDIIRSLRRSHASRIVRSAPMEARPSRTAYYGRAASIVRGLRKDLDAVRAAALVLRRAELIRADIPTVVIAGFPNTGKSTLITRLTRAKPEVAPYPFTTQWVHVGHTDLDGRSVQIVDTPGLLDRPLANRNPAEMRAIAALRHCAHVVLFLVDDTEFAGPPERQLALLEELRRGFPDARFIVAHSRADAVDSGLKKDGLFISGLTGEGVATLLVELASALPPEAAPEQPFDEMR